MDLTEDELFPNSVLVDPDVVKASRAFTTMPVRKNKRDDIADRAARAADQNWADLVHQEKTPVHCQGYSAGGQAASYWFFEAPPESMWWISYITELALLHDDIGEAEDRDFAIRWNRAWREGAELGEVNPDKVKSRDHQTLQLRNLFSRGLLGCLDIHPDDAARILNGVADGWLIDNPSTTDITDLDEYLAIRNQNAGGGCYTLWVEICSNISFSEEERKLLAGFDYAAVSAMILVNDYFSWDKEKNMPLDRLHNATRVIMQRDQVSDEVAHERLKVTVLEFERRALQERQDILGDHPGLPRHVAKWLELLICSVGGVHYWTSIAPRYGSPANLPPEAFSEPLEHAEPLQQPENPLQHSVKDTPNIEETEFVQRVAASAASMPPTTTKYGTRGNFKMSCLSESALLAPGKYMRSLSSKNFRGQMITALNIWYSVPTSTVNIISDVIEELHTSSLILDDMQDESPLRRGKTATHLIFGRPQAMNSATHMFVRAATMINSIPATGLVGVFLEELHKIFVGQSWDLKWRFDLSSPLEEEYLSMVDQKTGGMFIMLLRLLETTAHRSLGANIKELACCMGRWYQVRDDYMNLQDSGYAAAKGSCEDLDEGKLSFPVVKCMQIDNDVGQMILGMFRVKDKDGRTSLSPASKAHIKELLYTTGALQCTWDFIQGLERQLYTAIEKFEAATGVENSMLRLLIRSLAVDIPQPN